MQEIPTSGPLGMVVNGVWENSDVIPLKTVHSHGDVDPHLTHGSLGSAESTLE